MTEKPRKQKAPARQGRQKPGRPRPKRNASRQTKSSTSAKAIEREQLKRRIVDLRTEGLAIRAIADRVGRSKSEVQRLLDAAISELGPTQEKKRAVRALSFERLDRLLLGLWRRASKGDEKAVAQVLRIEERRAKLVGADAPTEQKLRLTVTGQLNWLLDVVKEELGDEAAERVYRRIAEATGPGATAEDED